jgi:hypothetical protein
MKNENMKSEIHELMSFEELAFVVGGTSPIKVVMDAYNTTLKEMAAAANKDALCSYGPLGSTNHPL